MLGKIFKAYDIRGIYPDLLTDQMAWQIGYGCAKYLIGDARAAGENSPMMRNIVVGRDMRVSSPKLSSELTSGINDFGADVIDVGMVDTSFIYFAVNYLDCAGGVMTTASHNPPQYNGFKISKRKAKPVGETTGLTEVRKNAAMIDRVKLHAKAGAKGAASKGLVLGYGHSEKRDLWDAYAAHVLAFLQMSGRPLKIVIDASNGMAGTMVPKIFAPDRPETEGLSIVELNFENKKGVFAHDPNPLVAANLERLREMVVAEKADLGVCFDGDADRCVVIDEKGGIVGCDHLTALLARHMLAQRPKSAVVYDLRSTKALAEEIEKAGGTPIRSRVGHVFMKANLSETQGCFGGELSGHFYFRDNFYADSGAIAMATLLTVLSGQRSSLSSLIRPIARYAQSGEINFEIEDKDEALANLKSEFAKTCDIDELDGVTIDCFKKEGWWCNVRKSNTEPLLRLNMEARNRTTLDKMLKKIAPMLGERVEH